MLEMLRDNKLINENPYDTANIKKLNFLPFMNIDIGSYGGRAKYVAELKDKDLFLIIDKDLRTIDVAMIKQEEKRIACKKCNLEFDNQGKFLSHARNCK